MGCTISATVPGNRQPTAPEPNIPEADPPPPNPGIPETEPQLEPIPELQPINPPGNGF